MIIYFAMKILSICIWRTFVRDFTVRWLENMHVAGSRAKIDAAFWRSFFLSCFSLSRYNQYSRKKRHRKLLHAWFAPYNKSRITIKALTVRASIVIINEEYCAYPYIFYAANISFFVQWVVYNIVIGSGLKTWSRERSLTGGIHIYNMNKITYLLSYYCPANYN